MAETTTAQAPVDQGPVSAESLEGTLEGLFGDTPEEKEAPAKPEPEQEAAADDEGDELNLDDIPDEDSPPQSADGVEFEIVHNGQQHKLTRAETIKLAQQGFDYTQKTQRAAEKERYIDDLLQRATGVEQLAPQVAQDLAVVQAMQAQLQQYAKVDWVRLATDDPLEYPKHRAAYDQLVQGYQQATGNFQQKVNAIKEHRQQITAYRLQQEMQALTERIPEWKDPVKYQAGAQELRSYLVGKGADPSVVDSLSGSLEVEIARKAMLYDKLVSAKASKAKQLRSAPPVVRPGAPVVAEKGKANFKQAQTALRKMGQQGKHNAQEQLLTQMLNRTFK
jgi:hypothetical protein